MGEVIGHMLYTIKPETTYLTEQDGKRFGLVVVDVPNPSGGALLCRAVFSQFRGRLQTPHADEPGGFAKSRTG
ncbi:hypothetical protein R0381_002992 [Jeongeupia wiesaeckerbachi]|uniref:hypothetical protein n=1 Tax=Jeongeupia wiesaeckerbachi TaxID=3051218 RepID=UPI003D803CE3